MYIQLNWYEGRLFEVFATLGHGGGCALAQSEGLTRSVTLGLKYGIPVQEYIRQLRGIRCPSPMPFPKEKAVWSCPDVLARVLDEYGTLGVDTVVGLLRGANGHSEEGEGLTDEGWAVRLGELVREREEAGLHD